MAVGRVRDGEEFPGTQAPDPKDVLPHAELHGPTPPLSDGDESYGRLFTRADVELILSRLEGVRDFRAAHELLKSAELAIDMHAEQKRIEWSEGAYCLRFPKDEPVLVLRASDPGAPMGAGAYFGMCAREGAPSEHLAVAQRAAEGLTRWQEAHPDRVKGWS